MDWKRFPRYNEERDNNNWNFSLHFKKKKRRKEKSGKLKIRLSTLRYLGHLSKNEEREERGSPSST